MKDWIVSTRTFCQAGAAAVLAAALTVPAGAAEDFKPSWERVGDGILLSVVPPSNIPPINKPEFVSADEADNFLCDTEPVLGVYDGQVARAYSLWLLDRHEVVNDSTPGFGPIAVTW